MLFQNLLSSNEPFGVPLAWLTDHKEVEDVSSCQCAVRSIIDTACQI